MPRIVAGHRIPCPYEETATARWMGGVLPSNSAGHSVLCPYDGAGVTGRNNNFILGFAGDLEEEPDAALGLVNPIFKQAGGGHVVRLVTQAVRGEHAEHERLIVLA
jgi:hypothetical protein